MKRGSRVDHNRFCTTEEWTPVRNARGGKVGHHVTYELPLPDGRVLRTRISRPVNTTTYGANLWTTIVRNQLEVTDTEFWSCVSDGVTPDRGGDEPEVPARALPAPLVWQLLHTANIPEEDVAQMTLDEAVAVLHAYWASERPH